MVERTDRSRGSDADEGLPLTRRRLLRGALAGGAMLGVGGLLGACGGDEEEAASATTTTTSTTPAGEWPDLSGRTITYVDYGGQNQDLVGEAMLAPFEELTGCKVLRDSPIDFAKQKAQIESGNVSWDVVYVDGFRANAQGVYEPIDKSIIDTSVIDPTLLTSDNAVPFFAMSTLLMYSTGLPAEVTAWKDFFDLEGFPGKRAAFNSAWSPNSGIFEAALLADGVPPEELYPYDLERVYAKMDTIRDSFVVYDTYAQAREQLRTGEVVMSIVPSGAAYQVAESGADVAPCWTQNLVSADQIGVCKGSKDVEASMWLIKYIIDPEAQGRFADATGYSPVSKDPNPPADELLAEYRWTEHKDTQLVMDYGYLGEHYEELQQSWVDWASG